MKADFIFIIIIVFSKSWENLWLILLSNCMNITSVELYLDFAWTELPPFNFAFRCMVYSYAFYTAVVVPVASILLGNTVILTIVMYKLHQNSKRRASNSGSCKEKRKPINGASRFLSEARIAFTCNLLLGTTWIFALLAVGDATIFFEWLFCVFNSLQGFFIFCFYAVRNQDVRNAWLEKLTKRNKKRISLKQLITKRKSNTKDGADVNRRGNCAYFMWNFLKLIGVSFFFPLCLSFYCARYRLCLVLAYKFLSGKLQIALHKKCFPLRASSANVTKFAVSWKIWPHLLKKCVMENFVFLCSVIFFRASFIFLSKNSFSKNKILSCFQFGANLNTTVILIGDIA